jgi:HK97 family phage prohead protease
MILSKHFNPLPACEVKMTGERSFEGYASVWGSVDSYGDMVAQGAFTKTLEDNNNIKMFFGHNSHQLPIGKWLEMNEDDKGLHVKGELTAGVRFADEVYAALKHRTVDGMSIGFYDRDSEELKDGGRLLKEVDLVEVSVVNLPAERNATITSVKTAIQAVDTLKDCEWILRDAGFSRAEATAFVSRLKGIWQSESVRELESKIKAQAVRDANTRAALDLIHNHSIRST